MKPLSIRVIHFLLHPTVRYVICWLIVAGGLIFGIHKSWHHFDWDKRGDGNGGHREIDFGGQWMMGRMLVEGYGQQLYHRDVHRKLLQRWFPDEDGLPRPDKTDVEQLMEWMMEVPNEGDGPTIGGPLYPPVHAFYYSPIALASPHVGYRILQVLTLLIMIPCGLGVTLISRGAIWWPVACLFLLVYPGLGGAANLGQNSPLSLLFFIWGWVALSRDKPILAGILWGGLAYKPVWAVTFCLVPLLTRRWSMLLSMMATGAILAIWTLPVVGLHSWFDWLAVGREASALYKVDVNWINLSRDALGIARRWLLDFDLPLEKRGTLLATALGWGALLSIFITTVWLSWKYRHRVSDITGVGPTFLLLGAFQCCYHYMYYDVLITALPVCLLLIYMYAQWQRGELTRTFPWWWHAIALVLIGLSVMLNHLEWYYFHYTVLGRMMIPYEQYGLYSLWIWCAITMVYDEKITSISDSLSQTIQ